MAPNAQVATLNDPDLARLEQFSPMRSPLLSPAAAKSHVPMAASDSALMPGSNCLFWREVPPESVSSDWLSVGAQKVLWWTLVAFALLDVVHPLAPIKAQWWCAFAVLWIVPWRRQTGPGISWDQVSTWISCLVLFSWLINRTQAAVMQTVENWLIFSSTPWWKLLSYPMHATIAAVVTALLTTYPLRRVIGNRGAVLMAMLASLPLTLRLATYIFIKSEKPLVIPIRVYAAVIPVLIMAEVASLLIRFPIDVNLIPGYRRLRIIVICGLSGRLNPLLAFFGLYAGAITAFLLVIRFWYAQDLTRPVALAIHSVTGPVSLLIVVLSALAAWRSLAGARGYHVIVDNLVTVGQSLVIASAAVVALLGFLFLMPRSGYALSQSLTSLSGPPWTISRSTTHGVLRLSGEFQHGVSDALASALARDPSIRLLELDSPGGDSDQGLELGALVEKYSLSTFVRNRCASACTFVFVAGRERLLMPGAKLGFHRVRSVIWDDQITDDNKYNEHITAYLEAKGVTASFAQKVFRVSNDDIWYPSVDELLGAGVISKKTID
jgi:hypothetical protein